VTEQLSSGVAQKLAYCLHLTRHFPAGVLRTLSSYSCVPYREGKSVGEPHDPIAYSHEPIVIWHQQLVLMNTTKGSNN